jgi:hypothetical protein
MKRFLDADARYDSYSTAKAVYVTSTTIYVAHQIIQQGVSSHIHLYHYGDLIFCKSRGTALG